MDLKKHEFTAAYSPPRKYFAEEVMYLALLERAYLDLKTAGYYKHTAIAWFLNWHPCAPPYCISFKRIVDSLELCSGRVEYLRAAALRADRGECI